MSSVGPFHRAVGAVIAPRLRNVGFRQSSPTSFLRPAGLVVQVIEFAPTSGQGTHFTVRLGIRVPQAPSLSGDEIDEDEVGATCCQVRASLGRLLCGKKLVWQASLEHGEAYRQMRDVLRAIMIYGLGWLGHLSEPTTLMRSLARASVRSTEPCRSSRLPASLVLGLLQEHQGNAQQARIWYERTLSDPPVLTRGLQRWLWDRLHGLP